MDETQGHSYTYDKTAERLLTVFDATASLQHAHRIALLAIVASFNDHQQGVIVDGRLPVDERLTRAAGFPDSASMTPILLALSDARFIALHDGDDRFGTPGMVSLREGWL